MKFDLKFKLIIFITLIATFFLSAEDFWMKLNFDDDTRRIFYTCQDEIFIRSDSIIYVSKDKGYNWDSLKTPFIHRLPKLRYVDDSGNYLFVSVIGEIYVSHKDSNNWRFIYDTENNEVQDIHKNRDNLFITSWGGVTKSNEDWSVWDKVLSTSLVEQFNAFTVDSVGTLYAGSINMMLDGGGIYRSFDDGGTWEWYPEQYAVATMGVDSEGRIFAGCFDKILRSIDNGETWQNVQSLSTWPASMLINSDDEIFLGFNDYSAVLYSDDNGESWQNISTGIEGASPIYDMAISPDGYVYLATGAGVYRSVNSTSIEISNNLVDDYKLYQNYPNPFNNQTNITFSIPENSEVKLGVYNIKGEFVKDICNKRLNKGFYNYFFKANDLNSGVYFYNIEINGKLLDSKKMLYIK